jgi:hypothetical protein
VGADEKPTHEEHAATGEEHPFFVPQVVADETDGEPESHEDDSDEL